MTTNKMVTQEQAEAVLALVVQKYHGYLHTHKWDAETKQFDWAAQVPVADSEWPHIREWELDDGDTQLAIVWESGSPSEWALEPLTEASTDPEFGFMVRGAKGSMPEGVYAEPYFSFVLVLYPEEG